ncbi:MAG: glycosyltransferase family 4 protein [Methanosarcinales archaeon]|nr:glycosyltransferase family 4 protein [Methanosarcinales archaeon]
MIRILFIHNTVMWYRRSFFKKISEIYHVEFIFTHLQVCKEIYGVEPFDYIEWMGGLNYKILKNYLNFIRPHGIAFGIVKKLMGDYDLVTGGSWDSISEIIETTIIFTISKLRRKPIILFREDWGWKRKNIKNKILTAFTKTIIKKSDAILVPGSMHKEYFISLGAQPEKTFIMPNVCDISITDVDYTNKNKIRYELMIEDKKIILYIGRLIKRKGVDYLIKAFARYRKEKNDVILIIIGQGECQHELEQLVRDLNITDSVLFKGYVEDDLIAAYYLLSNICIVPSITYEMGDPWVFVVNEAMFFGKPVITTEAVGAAYDMIQNGKNGYIVPEKDSNSIYIAMNKILSDPELEKKMGEESKKIINDGFRDENMVGGFIKAVDFIQKKGRKINK